MALPRAHRRRSGLWPAAALLMLALAGCDDTTASGPPPSSGPTTGPATGPTTSTTTSPKAGPTTGPTPGPPTTTTTAAPKPTSSAEGVELARSGGIAGITETIKVRPDGTWAKITSRGNQVTTTGKLTATQRAELQKLIADPRLAAEAGRKTAGNRCADAFTYRLVVRYQLIRYTSCGQADKPEVTMAIISLLQTATNGP